MAPFAGRIRNGRFTWQDREYQLPKNKAPHAIHGTTFDRPWEVVDADSTGVNLRIDLPEPWPFGGHVTQEFRLTHNSLHLRMEVHCGDEPMPASCGWHPWFRRQLDQGDSVVLEFEAESMLRRDDEGIPDGTMVPPPPGPWDDCFTNMAQPPLLHWPGALDLGLDSHCSYWVIFTEPDHAVCVEPQTGPPDAFNIDAATASPTEPVLATASFAWD
jgi:aldose 1-epimerase